MINKIYKKIHNKHSTLFNFIFFLRYLFGIFFISAVLFLLIPYFFDFKKKDEIIKNYLLENYDLTLNDYKDIKYNFLPTPNLEVQSVKLSLKTDSIKMNMKSLNIYPKLLSIYNFDNFVINKIILNENTILISDSDLKNLIGYIYSLKNRFFFKKLNLKINRKDTSLINLQNIYFSNYGYNKNIVRGKLFDKKFKILIRDNYNKINFELLKTGVSIDINFNEIKKNSKTSGILKSKLLNSKLKFNFDYDNNKIIIFNSYFRSKDLSFNNESIITYYPFFSLNSVLNIEDINIDLLKKININKVLISKNLIKKIITKNKIKFKSKKFSGNLIDDLNLDINLAYGRLSYVKTISISENFFTCKGDINLLKDYPILYFDCSVISKDKKNLLKIFSIKYKNKNEIVDLNVLGSINILNNKINFKNITMNQSYNASNEDLNYFKQSFEAILFNQDFLSIFELDKIKEFILEIS